MSGAAPDPIAFALAALAARGALVERSGDEGIALVEPALAEALGVPVEVRLVAAAARASDELWCGLGSPTLERLIDAELAALPCASARVDLAAPRSNQARSLAQRFAPRNGLATTGSDGVSDASYLVVDVRWVAEADERHEGLVRVALSTQDGAEPDPAALARWGDAGVLRDEYAGTPALADGLATLAIGRARDAATGAFEPIVGSVRRRHARDHQRIVTYFNALIVEAKSPRRRVSPETIAAKVASYRAERDGKLRDLGARYTLRGRLAIAAAMLLRVPVVTVEMTLKRRKAQGALVLRLPAEAAALDRLPCDACGRPTASPVLCDDALHLLCERCEPSATGRPDCQACKRRRPGRIL